MLPTSTATPHGTPDEHSDLLSAVTRRHVIGVVERYAGNRAGAARALGVTRTTLYKWLKDWGLESLGRNDVVPRRRGAL